MSVELDPVELGFRRPFNNEVSQSLRLKNPHDEPVAFKVKTTAPKQYCVRPNSGRIEPGGSVEVQVLLQAMKEDPPLDARCRDKFLVQSVGISRELDTGNVQQIWTSIEQSAKSSIQEKKIRVAFLPANGSAAATNGLLHSGEEDPPAYSSPSPAPVTPQRTPARQLDEKSGARSDDSTLLASTTSAISNVTGISQADLERQLKEAKQTISRLQTQAAESTGLRQRKADGTSSSSTTTSLQQAPAASGVPVQIVALLCLLSFIIAYLLF